MNFNLSPQITSILADIAGVAALALSIYIFIVNRRDHQPRLSIGIDRELVESDYDDQYGSEPPIDVIFVDIANPSERRIKVVSVLVEWSARKGLLRIRRQSDNYPNFQTSKKLPFILITGDNTTYATEADELCYWLADSMRVNGNVKIRMIVSDGTGNIFKSKWLQLDFRK